MKISGIILVPIFVFILLNGNCKSEPVKRGLIIAIGEYAKGTGWKSLSSANDAVLIKKTFLGLGFKSENITILRNEEATKQKIINAFDKLLSDCNEGDIIFLHYSGHGQRIQDDNGDENDTLDEALIPYDAAFQYSNKYKGENHLRDDFLGEYILKLRAKLKSKGSLHFFVDACFSGTILKANFNISGLQSGEIIRGTDNIFGSPEFTKNIYAYQNSKNSSGFYKSIIKINSEENSRDLSGFVLFTASRHNQLCYEIENPDGAGLIGPLSYSVCKVFSEIEGKVTYRQLFEKVYSLIDKHTKSIQQPQAEGYLDNVIFSNEKIIPEPYFTVTENDGKGKVKINGGELNGIYLNSIISFYPEGTIYKEGSEPLFNGVVTNSGFFSSDISSEFLTAFQTEDVMQLRLFIDKQSNPESVFKIKFSDIRETLRKEIEHHIGKLHFVKITDSTPDFIITEINQENNLNEEKIHLSLPEIKKNISVFDPNNPTVYKQLTDKLNDLYIFKKIKEAEFNDKRYGVETEIYSIKKIPHKNDYEIKPITSLAETGEIKAGDTIKLVIKNSGKNESYLTLTLLSPYCEIIQILPKPEDEFNKSEYLLSPGASYEKYVICDSDGLYYFKIFMTKEYVNLINIISREKSGPPELSYTESYFSDEKNYFDYILNLQPSGKTEKSVNTAIGSEQDLRIIVTK